MTAEDTAAVEELVMACLADPKQEVKEMAVKTLSGLLKGFSETRAASIRSRLLQRHAALFPAQSQRRAGASAKKGGPLSPPVGDAPLFLYENC